MGETSGLLGDRGSPKEEPIPVRCGFLCVITRMLREVENMASLVLVVLVLVVGSLLIVHMLFRCSMNEDEGDETDDSGG